MTVENESQALSFMAYVEREYGITPRPGDDFSQYVYDSGLPVFDPDEAERLNRIIRQAEQHITKQLWQHL